MLLKAYRIRNDSCITCLHAVRSRQPGGGRCYSSDISFGFLKEASTCRIEAPLDISFDEPLCPRLLVVDFLKGRVASPFWPESVAMFRELWFVIRFKNGAYYLLNHFI